MGNCFISFHFKNFLRRGTLQRKCSLSRVPPTKLKMHYRQKSIAKNLNTKITYTNKITTSNLKRKESKEGLKEQHLFGN